MTEALSEADDASVFVDNDGVRVHALDNRRADASLPTVLAIPGMGEYADEYAWLLDALGDRRVVVASPGDRRTHQSLRAPPRADRDVPWRRESPPGAAEAQRRDQALSLTFSSSWKWCAR